MTSLSKEEYLKRYLSSTEGDKKSKKKRRKNTREKLRGTGMKIVDDDVGWDAIAPDQLDEVHDKLLTQEEMPQIETMDSRTKEEKRLDEYRKSKMWKTVDENKSISHQANHRHDSDSDLDLNRKLNKVHKHAYNEGNNLHAPRQKPKHRRHDSDSDLDIPRNKGKHKTSSQNASTRSDSDQDLPRRREKHKVNKTRHDSDSDLNVRRGEINRESSAKKSRHDSDSDLDIPRGKANHKSSFKKSQHDSDSDLNIPRKFPKTFQRKLEQGSDSDLEVQRTSKSTHHSLTSKKQMGSGGMGGLTSVDKLRLEMKKLEKNESHMQKMATEYKDSSTVFRERGSGKKRNLKKEKEETEEEKRKQKKIEDQYAKWSQGIKQTEIRSVAVADALHESGKSLTRYNDDEDLEAMRKAAIRAEDPMAEYIAKKKRKEQGHVKEYPQYKGPAPAPNRFKIQPGYRWDGVNRSNGFEQKYFQSISDKQAYKDDYYKWSVADM